MDLDLSEMARRCTVSQSENRNGGGEGSILHSHFISLVHSTRFLYSVLWEYGMPINSENYTELWELIQALVAKEI